MESRLGASLFAGMITGFLGIGLFLTAHAMFIVPIWDRVGFGIPFALAAALAIAWFHHELVRAGRLGLSWQDGARFGLGIWLLFLPATVIGVIARLTPLHQKAENLEVVLEVLSAIGLGGILGQHFAGRRGAISGALAALTILATVGGPTPIVSGGRAIRIWLSLLLVLAIAGVFHTILVRRLISNRLTNPS